MRIFGKEIRVTINPFRFVSFIKSYKASVSKKVFYTTLAINIAIYALVISTIIIAVS